LKSKARKDGEGTMTMATKDRNPEEGRVKAFPQMTKIKARAD